MNVLVWIVFTIPAIFSQDCSVLTDPLVFDALFYLNSNPDLMEAGLSTLEDAVEHWCSMGVDEIRQASSMFHSRQYLDRYPDLEEAFPGDLRRATEHYVLTGFGEGRVGYLEGGGYKRWTISSNNPVSGYRVYVSTSERTAGAVDSLVWGNKEYINNHDHGRQFQLALTTPPYGECWNPTEAGGSADYRGEETKSIIQSITASANVLQTTNHPAYWFRPGAHSPGYTGEKCQPGDPTLNEVDTHPFNLTKRVTIGCFGMENCIQWEMDGDLGSGLGMPTDYDHAQLEGATAYCMADFSEAKRWNYDTGELIPAEAGSETIYPVIIHTPDEGHALGGYGHPSEDLHIPLQYSYYNFGITGFIDGTYKWAIIWRDDKAPGEHMVHASWACVGNLSMVVECLTNVRNSLLEK